MKKRVLVLFDFDGTISTGDSFMYFTYHYVGFFCFLLGLLLLSPYLVLFFLNLISSEGMKQRFVSFFFKGESEERFREKAKSFAHNQLKNIVRDKAIEKIKWHIENGHKILIVSASIECYLKQWANEFNIDVISTRLEFKDGVLTGRLSTPNCKGIEKVKRIKEVLNIENYDEVYVYGDSEGDREMFMLATKKFYKPFRN